MPTRLPCGFGIQGGSAELFDFCLMCSGQDSSREARESQGSGESHFADGTERTDHREGILQCCAACVPGSKTCNVDKLHAAAPAHIGTVLCKAPLTLPPFAEASFHVCMAAGIRGAPYWPVGADWAAGCKQRADKGHNATAEDRLG